MTNPFITMDHDIHHVHQVFYSSLFMGTSIVSTITKETLTLHHIHLQSFIQLVPSSASVSSLYTEKKSILPQVVMAPKLILL